MQWIKDKLGGTHAAKQQNSSSPSAPMAPLGSFTNPESAESALQNYNGQPNPYVLHAPASDKGGSEEDSSKLKIDDDANQRPQAAADSKHDGSDEEEDEVLTGSQVLVTIPGAIVHLIDNEDSVHLATGDFSLVRLVQEKTKVVVIAKVGEDLKWPLFQEEPTVKLDPTHYFFSLRVPKDIESDYSSSSERKKSSLEADVATEMDTLNYGLTLPAGSTDEMAVKIQELDHFLNQYSMFSAPVIGQGDSKEVEAVAEVPPDKVVSAETVSGDGKVVASEEASAAFWTTVAPNVDDYNSKLARGIATGAGHIIRGIFWLSDSTVAQLDSGHIFMKSKFKPNKKKSTISPITMASVRRVRKLSGMTDKVANGVLEGIVYTTGLFSGAVVNSAPGKKFFKLLPGEVALVSLDAFGRVFDAIEKAGTNVMVRSSSVTQDFVNYRYGESAQELTDESFKTVGHVASTAWTLTKIRKALNPKKFKVSKTGVAKSLAKNAVGATGKGVCFSPVRMDMASVLLIPHLRANYEIQDFQPGWSWPQSVSLPPKRQSRVNSAQCDLNLVISPPGLQLEFSCKPCLT